MDRKETTKFLINLLEARLSDRKYYAKEVTLDYGTIHPKRVDVMQFVPEGVTYTSDIEKGKFICYEIKSCIQDVYSGNGLRFYGEQNYIVTTMETYKKLIPDFNSGKFQRYLKENYPESNSNIGVMVAVPYRTGLKNSDEIHSEFENPTELNNDIGWKLYIIQNSRPGRRTRAMNELLFCMLRSKHNN